MKRPVDKEAEMRITEVQIQKHRSTRVKLFHFMKIPVDQEVQMIKWGVHVQRKLCFLNPC